MSIHFADVFLGDESMNLIEFEVYAVNLTKYNKNPYLCFQDNNVYYYTNQTEVTYTTKRYTLGDNSVLAYHLFINPKNTTIGHHVYRQYNVIDVNGTICFVQDNGTKLFARESGELFTFERYRDAMDSKGELPADFGLALGDNFGKFMQEQEEREKLERSGDDNDYFARSENVPPPTVQFFKNY